MQTKMTAKRVIDDSIVSREEFEINLSQFLDDFYSCDNNDEKYLLIKDEYTGEYSEENEMILRIIAATVDELCFRYQLEQRPEWIDKKKFIGSDKPIFYGTEGMTQKGRVYLMRFQNIRVYFLKYI